MAANLYDDDPFAAEVERIAEEWVRYERHIDHTLHDLRERAVAVATARLIGEDPTPAEYALRDHLDQIDEDLLRELLAHALWDGAPIDGGKAAEREARGRLLRMRDANSLAGIEELGGAA